MCDDFFEDNFEENVFDSDNDNDEDCADEYAFDDTEMMDMPGESHSSPEQEEQRSFDLGDAFVFGSMIYGNAYEEMLDSKKQQLIKKDKNKIV